MAQFEPFQCSTKLDTGLPLPVMPTAQLSEAETLVTEASDELTDVVGSGVVTVPHVPVLLRHRNICA